MDKHIHVYTHILILCIYVTIFQCLTCAHMHAHSDACITPMQTCA